MGTENNTLFLLDTSAWLSFLFLTRTSNFQTILLKIAKEASEEIKTMKITKKYLDFKKTL